jgi:hypothetical protein
MADYMLFVGVALLPDIKYLPAPARQAIPASEDIFYVLTPSYNYARFRIPVSLSCAHFNTPIFKHPGWRYR